MYFRPSKERKNLTPYIIGIAGGSASGKTTLINLLTEKFNKDTLTVISQDNYYKGISKQEVDTNGQVNFDLPDGIDFDRLAKDVKKLKNGQEIKIVEYTFNNPNKFPREIVFKPSQIIVIEGLFIYHSKSIEKLFDLKVYIDATEEIMLARRLKRDKLERGMTEEQIMYQWTEHVLPAYNNYLLPHKSEVDLIIVNNVLYTKSFLVLCDHINMCMERFKDFKPN